MSGLCKICGAGPCAVVVPPPPAPFTVVRLDGELWFNVPSTLNWNWLSMDLGGWWCWEDLWHAGMPELVPFDWSTHYWGCTGNWLFEGPCRRVWTVEEMGRLIPGDLSSAPRCGCCGGLRMWPFPKKVANGH